MIRIKDVDYKMFKFSGGELQVEVSPTNEGHITIEASLVSSDDIMELMMVTDALRRVSPGIHLDLRCPYLPYARQDRVMNPGEALGIRVMCDLINSLQFERVEVWDVHSDVALALLNNATNCPPQMFAQMIPIWNTHPILVAPDAGAIKKVHAIAKDFGMEMVRADKSRSVVDGSITKTIVYSEHVGDRDFLIVDDICDGGRTFIELAKVLRPLTNGKIYLYVTHGIFSKGLGVFDGIIDQIYCPNVFPSVDANNPLLYRIPISEVK